MLLKDIGIIVAIVVVDLALSGDNAVVIGSVAAQLKGRQRRQAIFSGGLIAIVLRVILTFLAVFLLAISYVSIIGGVIVFVIAVQLIRDVGRIEEAEAEAKSTAPKRRFRQIDANTAFTRAITTIALADLSMSLDNALAIAGLATAHGNKEDTTTFLLLAFGLLLSILLLLLASALIASLIERYPVLMYVSGIILAVTAGNMILTDPGLKQGLQHLDTLTPGPLYFELQAAIVLLFGVCALIFRPRDMTRQPASK